jgi:hypothetical protein
MMKLRTLLTGLVLVFSTVVNAQELRCRVSVNGDQVQLTNKRVFKTLETSISEFMNNYKWTRDNFTTDERIECAILINISKFESPDQYTATIQVTANRPVYNTSYSTSLINHRDQDFNFTYLENAPIEFSPDQFRSNLSSVLAYYAYLIIGLDYDSFALNGGTPYLQKALGIVNFSQDASEPGWKAFENNKNRYWLINNLMDASFVPLRECYYNYHRKGLDAMTDNKEAGRAVIAESIESLKKVHLAKPLSFSMQVFFNAKSDEIINIFSGAFTDEKAKIVNTLNEIDPTNANKYAKITNTN